MSMSMKRKKREKAFFQKEAARAFSILLAKKEPGQTYEDIGLMACEAAKGLIKAIKEHSLLEYFEVLNNYTGEDALRRLLYLDGNSENLIDHLVKTYYIDKPDMIRSYAADYHEETLRSTGQIAAGRWLASKGEPPIVKNKLRPIAAEDDGKPGEPPEGFTSFSDELEKIKERIEKEKQEREKKLESWRRENPGALDCFMPSDYEVNSAA